MIAAQGKNAPQPSACQIPLAVPGRPNKWHPSPRTYSLSKPIMRSIFYENRINVPCVQLVFPILLTIKACKEVSTHEPAENSEKDHTLDCGKLGALNPKDVLLV